MKNDTYLIQRLDRPAGHLLGGVFKDNPFSFGGGLKNGGLSDEAMDLLRDVFSFDYMGAAEYEFGAVPKAIQRVAENAADYTAFSFIIPLKNVAKNWRDTRTTEPEDDGEVFVICAESDVTEVKKLILDLAAEKHDVRNVRDATFLARALRPPEDERWGTTVCGWLELDNGFFFFTDREMWEKTAKLFAVEVTQ